MNIFGPKPWDLYSRLFSSRPRLFKNMENGIEIVIDKQEVAFAEKQMATSIAADVPNVWRRVGVLYSDSFYTLLKDAVRFPDGRLGTYTRVVTNAKRGPGVCIFPVLAGKFLLVRQFRHATRSFHLAIPRGFGEPGVSVEDSARREVFEETGCAVERVEKLGIVYPDTGFLADSSTVFLAHVTGSPKPERGEAISEIIEINPDDFVHMIAKNQITDSFTLAAFSILICSGRL
jgi:ADP-ribose pyrophosphatase